MSRAIEEAWPASIRGRTCVHTANAMPATTITTRSTTLVRTRILDDLKIGLVVLPHYYQNPNPLSNSSGCSLRYTSQLCTTIKDDVDLQAPRARWPATG